MFLEFNFPKYATSITTVSYAAVIGIFLAGVLAIYYRSTLGGFIRYLLKQKIFSPESAVGLEDTPYAKNYFVLSAIRSNRIYHKILRFTDKQGEPLPADNAMQKIGKNTALSRKYYIPEDLKYKAEFMFSRRGTNPLTLVISVIAFIILAFVCIYILPWALEKIGIVITNI